jgi:predicted permease
LLLISALAVLLIACTNVANLVLAQSAARRHELAVRSALGGGRFRLFRQRLTESMLLALLGATAGCGLAYALVHGLVALAPAGIPRLPEANVDLRALLVALALSIAAGIGFGTIPALEKPNLETLVASTAAGVRRARLRQMLIFAQVWMTIMLLTGAFLFMRSLHNLQTQSLGMDTQNVVTAELTLGQQKYSSPAERLAFFEGLERGLRRVPGVAATALSDSLPPREPARTMPFIALEAEGRPPLSAEQGIGGVVGWRSVTPNYFKVLGIPLLRGRSFEEGDRNPGPGAIILNQALAQRLYPGQEALGRTIRFHLNDQHLSEALTVVGVTGNVQNQGLTGRVGPEYYVVRRHSADDVIFRFPDSQRVSIVARSVVDSPTVARELREVIASLDPTLPAETSALGQSVFQLATRPRFDAALLGLFAGIALVLAAAGIYGLVSLLVSQRTQEIAIRIALGAEASNVTQIMVSQILIWIGLGVTAGLFCSLIAGHWVAALLFGIKPNDPLTLAGAVALLVAMALAAAYIPARRAAKVDPMVALRYE